MGRFLVRKSHVALSVANERIAAPPSDGESLIALGPIVAATEAHVIDADNEPFEALIAAAAGRIQSAKGGWRDAAHLVALAKDEAAKFARTRAGERAGQIVAAARVKVESLVKDDLDSLDEELMSTEESWVGLAHLGEIGRIVDDNENLVPAPSDYRPSVSARRVESLSQGYRERFSRADAGEAVGKVTDAMVARLTQLIRVSLPRFEEDMTQRNNTRESAAKLQEVAAALDQRAQRWPDFKAYAEPARRRVLCRGPSMIWVQPPPSTRSRSSR